MFKFILSVIVLAISIIVALPYSLICLIVRIFSKKAAGWMAQKYVVVTCRVIFFISGSTLDVQGFDNIPDDEAVLFVSNHRGIFDIITLYPIMKKQVGFVSKKELRKFPIFNWMMWLCNCIFLDRKDPRNGLRMISKASSLIGEGISILIFPEGTRSRDENLLEFKEGALKIASKSKCTIVPVAIANTGKIFEDQFPRILAQDVKIKFGEAIDTSDWSRADFKGIGKRLHDEIESML